MMPSKVRSPKTKRQPETEVIVSTYFSGIVFEEDIEEALAKCVKILGPIGKYEFGPGTHPGVVLATKQHGKLWYGDLTADDVLYRLEALRVQLGVDELLAYDFESENRNVA